jgi:hypothetical protein
MYRACVPQEYLERYYMLIAFAGYLSSGQFDPGSPAHVSFPDWMAERPELRRSVGRMVISLSVDQQGGCLGGPGWMGRPGGWP